MSYSEDDFLALSGIQHFRYCRRQWALIHLEGQWRENYRTADGRAMHQRAHDRAERESRGDLLIARGMRVFSEELGIAGECDVVEFRRAAGGVPLSNREGLWLPFPIEYKRGSPKDIPSDVLQLCAQAMCLEFMLCCEIRQGALFYGETRRRERVEFTTALRDEVRALTGEMHDLARSGHTPRVRPNRGCNACSLKELCLPKLLRGSSAKAYLERVVREQCDDC